MRNPHSVNQPRSHASWRDHLAVHPACELFPSLPPDELRALGADILKNNFTSPIVLWRADPKGPAQLLDGANRWMRSKMVIGKPVEVGAPSIAYGDFLALDRVIVLDHRIDPYAFVLSANVRRRHLSVEDKDRLIVQLLKLDPRKSNRQVPKLTDTSHPHVAKVREQAGKTGDVETVSTSIDTKGRQQPSRKPRLNCRQVLRGKRSHGPADDLIAGMEEIDPKDGRAKALAVIVGVWRSGARSKNCGRSSHPAILARCPQACGGSRRRERIASLQSASATARTWATSTPWPQASCASPATRRTQP